MSGSPAAERRIGVFSRTSISANRTLPSLRESAPASPDGRAGAFAESHSPVRLAAGTADDLMQQLKRALGGAWIAIGKDEIGINDADQIELPGNGAPWRRAACRSRCRSGLAHTSSSCRRPLHRSTRSLDSTRMRLFGIAPGLLLEPFDAGTDREEAALRSHFGTLPSAAGHGIAGSMIRPTRAHRPLP